jgi:hypothetical protein
MPPVNGWPRRFRRVGAGVAIGGLALLMVGCSAGASKPEPREAVVWKRLGEWSGRGDAQTESFVGLTGALRMHWRTTNEAAKGAGRFRMMLQSAISGRDLQETVNEIGVGEGTAYAADDPRVFQISVQSANVDWWFTVEEAMFQAAGKGTGGLR